MYTALIEQVNTFLPKEDIKTEELMSKHTSFRVGGPAKVFLTVRSEESLSKVLKLLKESQLPYFVLGNGSNLLVSDKGYDGVIVHLGKEFSYVKIEDCGIQAGAATFLGKVAGCAMEAGLTGLEFAAGIPGSLGGGVVMNAGAYGGELSQVITSVRAMNADGNIVELENHELLLGYRTSIFKVQPYVILQVQMELAQGNKEEILWKMNEYNRQRREKQPLEYPSAGSTFKRPEGHFAGKLIMDAGLRGYRIGGAMVSEKHCGFVVNVENATAADVTMLMEEVDKIVFEKFEVHLEPEVRFLGDF